MEMRLVKFRLNYNGAREVRQLRSQGTTLESGSSTSDVPRRFVMPGQTEDDLQQAVTRFLELVADLDNADAREPGLDIVRRRKDSVAHSRPSVLA